MQLKLGLSDIIASPHYEEFYPPTYKGAKRNKFFLNFQKSKKIFAFTYYGVKMQKFFPKNDEKIKTFLFL